MSTEARFIEAMRPTLSRLVADRVLVQVGAGTIRCAGRSACRHLIKDRLDITGARWSVPGAEAVLKLRALISEGDFEPYFVRHCQPEHQRNHQALYQEKLSLAA